MDQSEALRVLEEIRASKSQILMRPWENPFWDPGIEGVFSKQVAALNVAINAIQELMVQDSVKKTYRVYEEKDLQP